MEKDFLRVATSFNAGAERLFRAFTTEAELMDWFQPFVDYTVPFVVELEVEDGGSIRIVMEDDDSNEHTLEGEYIEIVPNEVLTLTFHWVEDEQLGETTVTIQFLGEDGRTELVITQEGILDDELKQRYQAGWMASMENLEHMLSDR